MMQVQRTCSHDGSDQSGGGTSRVSAKTETEYDLKTIITDTNTHSDFHDTPHPGVARPVSSTKD